MIDDSYINSLKNEINELKAQNEILRCKLLIHQENKLHAISNLIEAMRIVNEL